MNHPNIAGIYGLEPTGDGSAIVLELVEGETLADLIARGPLPLAEALPIARQLIEALEAAHEKGVIHRDLKPANIKVTPGGAVKVLDFGLAAVVQESGFSDVNATHSPTLTIAATRAGVILGTAAYMSPEQASGKAADKRADIWGFGVVLWEMLTGLPLFDGETVSHTLALVLTKDPDWGALPESTPSPIRRLLRRCLDRERKRRLPDIASARLEVDDALTVRDTEAPVAAPSLTARGVRLSVPLIVLAAAIIGAIAVSVLWVIWRAAPIGQPMHVDVATPPSSSAVAVISPDGRKIVFGAFSDAGPQQWIRSLDSPTAEPLPQTERGQFPFWSPDSRSIAFYADGSLKRLDIGSRTALTLMRSAPFGGAWSRDGVILIASANGEFVRLSDQDGKPSPVLDRSDSKGRPASRRVLEFLPDQNHFLYFQIRGPADDQRGIYVSDLAGSAPRLLVTAAESAAYGTGYLFFVRNSTLFALAFDSDTQMPSGTPIIVADAVVANSLSVSASGPILYRSGGDRRVRRFAWVDRMGNERAVATVAGVENWSLAPDERRVAIQRLQNQNVDIWLYDLERLIFSPITFYEGLDLSPIWSPDSTRVAFSSPRQPGQLGQRDLFEKTVGSGESERVLLSGPPSKRPNDWSRDGRFLLYEDNPQNRPDLWALPMQGDRKPFPVVQTPSDDSQGQFSPNGEWIAYQSNESGQPEIYAQRFPRAERKVHISTNGGAQVRWGPDGRELFYIDLDGRLISVPLEFSGSRRELVPGKAVPMFRARVGTVVQQNAHPSYAVAKDGSRFLMSTLPEEIVNAPIRMILNWRPPTTAGN